MGSLELFNKEINLAGQYMEHAILCSVDMMDIELFEEAGNEDKTSKFANMSESIKKLIEKIRDAVGKFFKKVKDAVNKKLRDFKDKVEIKKLQYMWKKNLNNVIKITDFVEEKQILNIYKEVVNHGFKTLDKLNKTNDPSTLRAIKSEFETYMINKHREIEKLGAVLEIKCTTSNLNPYTSMNSVLVMEDLAEKALLEIEQKQKVIIAKNAVDDLKKAVQNAKDEKAKEKAKKVEEAATEKKSIISSVASKISTFGEKCTSVIANNKGKIIVALTAMGVTAAGIYAKSQRD